jgi:DNA-binding MarR family transcriptional regulator
MRISPLPRRRDSLLEALELLRSAEPAISLTHTLAFLYICENEGLNVSELAAVCRMTIATASRTARALTAPGAPDSLRPSPGWVESRPNPTDSKGRVLFLTEEGCRLRDRLDRIIRDRQTIKAAEEGAGPDGEAGSEDAARQVPLRLRRAS